LKDQSIVTRAASPQSACIVLSNHPLVCSTSKRALAMDPSLSGGVKPYSSSLKPCTNCDILILDTCSVERWAEVLERWQSAGGRSIVVVSGSQTESDELQMLYLGASGIVAFSENFNTYLPHVVCAVAQGELWVRREVLNEYVRRTNPLWRHISSSDHFFTAREQEIVGLLWQGHSNKQIASTLGISERTAKFHVSNILGKCEMKSRRELLGADHLSPRATDLLRFPTRMASGAQIFPGSTQR